MSLHSLILPDPPCLAGRVHMYLDRCESVLHTCTATAQYARGTAHMDVRLRILTSKEPSVFELVCAREVSAPGEAVRSRA